MDVVFNQIIYWSNNCLGYEITKFLNVLKLEEWRLTNLNTIQSKMVMNSTDNGLFVLRM